MSRRTPIYYVDLGIRGGMALDAAIAQAVDAAVHDRKTGRDQEALEQAARTGYALGLFEELSAEAAEIVDEFYPASDDHVVANLPADAQPRMRQREVNHG